MDKCPALQLQSSRDIGCLLLAIEECLNGFASKISQFKDIAAPDDHSRLLEYEDQVQKLKAKKESLEALKDKYLQLESERNSRTSKRIKQESLELDRQLLAQSASLGLSDSSEETQSAFLAMHEYLTDSENQLMSTRRQSGEELDRKINQEEAVLASLVDLSRVRLILSEDRRMVVEMLSPNQADSSILAQESSEIHPSLLSPVSELSQRLRLTIIFADADKTSVASIQVNVPTLEVDDLLHEAQRTNNLHLLLLSIYQRWTKYFHLLEEIEPLRRRYALDWLHSEGVVRVLCGSQSQITCTLKLHDDYPSVSWVTLQSATGLPPDFNLDTVQVPSNATLGRALEFLRNKLNHPATEQFTVCT